MKVKYISNYRDGTEWSKAATYNMLALDNAGIKVIPENISYNNNSFNRTMHPKVRDLEFNVDIDCEIAIHHCLPNSYKQINYIKNYGCVGIETNTLDNPFWTKPMSIMDEMIVPNNGSKNCLSKYGISSKVFNYWFDFDLVYNSQKMLEIQQLANSFNILFIGEFSKRNNVEALIRAFHSEFQPFENVNLVIKTNNQSVIEFLSEVKKRLKLRKNYKDEIVITNDLNDNQLYSLMRQCHLNVLPSYGAAWSYSILEGMALGLLPVYTSGIGIEDYAKESYSFKVNSKEANCYGATDTFIDLYTGNDYWFEIDIADLQYKLRQGYELFKNKKEWAAKSAEAINDASNYDYKKSNNSVNKLLEELK